MLSSMKTVKMLGLQDHIADRVTQLRQAELFAASRVRWLMIYHNASGE
jgi:hypothetical protein